MYTFLTGSDRIDRKFRKTREKKSRLLHFQHIVVVVGLFYVPGLFECGFRKPVECTRSGGYHFEKLQHKKNRQTCTVLAKIKTRIFQNSLEVEVKLLSCKLSKAQHYMKSLTFTFLQRLVKCTFLKLFKNSEKF